MTLSKHLGFVGAALALGALCSVACDDEPGELQLTERALEGNQKMNGDDQLETAFELDGDAMDGPIAGIDWSMIHSNQTDMAKTKVFISDPAPLSTFSGGGSKDTQDLGSWRYKNGSVPDKDNITNAYAAAYNNPDGDLIIYFGADRFANDGEALLGFWFFQDNVQLGANGRFTGTHKNGDLLILANFSKGGSVADIQALEWMNGSLTMLDSSNAACDSGAATHQCAIANTASTNSPWEYIGKDALADGPFPPSAFFEGGVNITKLFAAQNEAMPCFASFLAETRASTSVSATLKDFAIGSFPVCGLGISATCADSTLNADKTGYVHSFDGTVTNSGLGTIYGVEVAVSSGDDATAVALGTLGAGASVPFTVEIDTSETSATLSASVKASTTGPNGPFDLTASVDPQLEPTCNAPVYNPAISLQNTCAVSHVTLDGKLVVQASHDRRVCNDTPVPEGQENSVTMDITITDVDTDTILEVFEDVPAASCVDFDLQHYPTSLDANLGIAHNLRATGTISLYPNEQYVAEQPASCSMCL